MKKYLLLLALAAGTGRYAPGQTCAPNGITTNPAAPVNTQRPTKLNKFDWTQSGFPLNSAVTTINATRINSPFFTTDEASISFFYDPIPGPKDLYPSDGWELIKKDFGFDDDNNPRNPGVTNPYLLLYNKYRGVLRLFVAKLELNTYQGANVQVSFDDKSPTQTSLLDFNAELKPIAAPFTPDPSITSIVDFRSTLPLKWFYADLPMNYDPCTCLYESKINIQISVSNTSSVSLSGSTLGELVSQGKPTEGSAAPSSFTLGDLKKAGKKAIDSYKAGKSFADKLQKDVDKLKPLYEDGYPFDGKPVVAEKKEAVNKFAKLVSKSDFLKGGLKAVPYIGAAVSVLDFFLDGGKKTAGTTVQDVNIMPMSISMTSKYTGVIETKTFYNALAMRVPGSNPGNAPDSEYPYYNEVLGVFNLLETPKCNLYTQTYTLGGGEDFTNITTYTSYKFQLAQDLKYVLNPASGLEVQEIQAAIVFGGKNVGPSVGNLTYDSYDPSDGNGHQYRTDYTDLACMSTNIFEVTSSDNPNETSWQPGKAYLKLLVNLKRKDGTENTQNVLFVAKYPMDRVETTTPLGDAYYSISCSRALYAPQSSAAVQTFCQSSAYKTSTRGFNNYQQNLKKMEEAEREGARQRASESGAAARLQLRPNPASDRTVIRYYVPQTGAVHLSLTDGLGQKVATLVDEPQHEAGYFELEWNAQSHPHGLYLCTLETSGQRYTQKLVVAK